MELQFYGANCIKITSKKYSIVLDDNLAKLGLKTVVKKDDIYLRTAQELIPAHQEVKFSADMPGEYEISGAIIHGIGARSHMDPEGKQSAVIYTVESDDVKVAIIGHIYPELSDEQLESIGMVDVAIVPVGGNGYTLDGVGALKVIKKIEPKVVIPTHFADKDIKFEVPQTPLSEALKGLGMEPSETMPKLKLTPTELSDSTKLIVLERQ